MSDISIGDLVYLSGDEELVHGIGLVLEKREDTADMLRDFLGELGVPDDNKIQEEINVANNYILNSSVFLVHWQGGRNKNGIHKNIWMFSTEIELLSKVRNDLGEKIK